jgi:hypothetical protein
MKRFSLDHDYYKLFWKEADEPTKE